MTNFARDDWQYNLPTMDFNLIGRQTSLYTVQTPIYDGPLDLLLQLIERAELDITALSLAKVTDQYLEHIRTLEVSPEDISAFLVVAAKLLQIKSEALLPRPPVREKGEEELGISLAEQLRLYKRYKELGEWLEKREVAGLRSYLRIAPPPKLEGRLDLSDVTLSDLLAAAENLYASERGKQSLGTVISPPRISIREKIAYIADVLTQDRRSRFNRLVSHRASRLEIVVTFLALLELIKRYRVAAQQESLFGEIEIERLEEWGANDDLELEFE